MDKLQGHSKELNHQLKEQEMSVRHHLPALSLTHYHVYLDKILGPLSPLPQKICPVTSYIFFPQQIS